MPARYPHPTLYHANGNLLCAVDVETTGLNPSRNAIIEICVLPLLPDYTINKKLMPFDTLMKPSDGKEIDPDAMRVNKIDLPQLLLYGLDSDKVADLFLEWFEKLNLGPNKRIIPLAQNYPFDRSFIIEWLGVKTYELIFDRSFRDTMCCANFLNDVADMKNQPCPYPKQSLSVLAGKYKITNPSPHRAIGDCVTTAAVYKEMLKEFN